MLIPSLRSFNYLMSKYLNFVCHLLLAIFMAVLFGVSLTAVAVSAEREGHHGHHGHGGFGFGDSFDGCGGCGAMVAGAVWVAMAPAMAMVSMAAVVVEFIPWA